MKRILPVIVIAIAAGVVYGYMQYSKPAKTEVESKAEVMVSATAIFEAFNTNEAAANTTYLGKTVEVSGTVKEVAGGTVNLDTGDPMVIVVCGFGSSANLSGLKEGDLVKILGACDGFSGFDIQFSKCKLLAQ